MRVHRRVVNADFVVEVRTSAAAARSYVADDVAAMNGFTFSGCISGHVSEERGDAMAVIDDDRASIAVDIVSRSDSAIGGSDDRRSERSRDIHSGVECAFTVERIDPFAKRSGHNSFNRP